MGGITPPPQVAAITGLNNCSNYTEDTFSMPWRCSGQLYGEELQLLVKSYYEATNAILGTLFTKIYSNEIFGRDCMEYYDRMNDIHYLLWYMLSIYYRRKDDETLDPTTFAANEYYVTYDIECIRKRFKCKGIEIYQLLEVFDIQTATTEFFPSGEGVGYDIITDNGETNIGHYFNELEVY